MCYVSGRPMRYVTVSLALWQRSNKATRVNIIATQQMQVDTHFQIQNITKT